MIKKIGYACINTNLKPRSFRECRLNSVYKYGIDYLRDRIINNLILTKDILKWNMKNQILMYRATSNLFPLVDHPDILRDFKWRWQKDEEILNHMKEIKHLVENNHIRLSMHPDQFTVLNSINENVVKNSVANIEHHYEVLTHMGGTDIIIHTGGVYGDKKASMDRFIKNFKNLDNTIQKILRLENDDVSYTVEDVLYISGKAMIPVVLDIHHHRCNNGKALSKEDMLKINNTWINTGLVPKMHISSGKASKQDKRHGDYIEKDDLMELVVLTKNMDMDLMVEAKKKEEAVLQIINRYHIWRKGE